jgi:hypothetical protein
MIENIFLGLGGGLILLFIIGVISASPTSLIPIDTKKGIVKQIHKILLLGFIEILAFSIVITLLYYVLEFFQ